MNDRERQHPDFIDYGRALSEYEPIKKKWAGTGCLSVCMILIVFVWFAMMGIGIWPPDIIFAPRSVLGQQKLPDGNVFQVIQYWNGADFYNTELWHTRPDGTIQKHVLDGDDNKTWSVPIKVDTQNRIVMVTLGGNRMREIRW